MYEATAKGTAADRRRATPQITDSNPNVATAFLLNGTPLTTTAPTIAASNYTLTGSLFATFTSVSLSLNAAGNALVLTATPGTQGFNGTYTWNNAAGTGRWNTTDANFIVGAGNGPWANGGRALFSTYPRESG